MMTLTSVWADMEQFELGSATEHALLKLRYQL
jgi:hypothetical protein